MLGERQLLGVAGPRGIFVDVDHVVPIASHLRPAFFLDARQRLFQRGCMLEILILQFPGAISLFPRSTAAVVGHASVSSKVPISVIGLKLSPRYPAVYCLGIMPLSVVRWITFVQEAKHGGAYTMSSAATLTSQAVFGLSGFFNVLLLLTTKPESGLFGQLMFISPARPPLTISDPFRDERSTEDEYQMGKLPAWVDTPTHD